MVIAIGIGVFVDGEPLHERRAVDFWMKLTCPKTSVVDSKGVTALIREGKFCGTRRTLNRSLSMHGYRVKPIGHVAKQGIVGGSGP